MTNEPIVPQVPKFEPLDGVSVSTRTFPPARPAKGMPDLRIMIQRRYEANLRQLDRIVARNWADKSIDEMREIADRACSFPTAVTDSMIWASRQRVLRGAS